MCDATPGHIKRWLDTKQTLPPNSRKLQYVQYDSEYWQEVGKQGKGKKISNYSFDDTEAQKSVL